MIRRKSNYGFGFGRPRRYMGRTRRLGDRFGPYGPMGRGYGRCYYGEIWDSMDYKELLEDRRRILTERLEEIDKELEDL